VLSCKPWQATSLPIHRPPADPPVSDPHLAVIPLYSPPACPGYHGSIEAAIGSLKSRTQHQARAQGHGGRWEQADLAAA
jgi:hypothetical protein